eukprot:4145674-Amphidinium_carterae.1
MAAASLRWVHIQMVHIHRLTTETSCKVNKLQKTPIGHVFHLNTQHTVPCGAPASIQHCRNTCNVADTHTESTSHIRGVSGVVICPMSEQHRMA